MYVPSHFKEDDLSRIKDFIRTNDFATVVSWDGRRPLASHLLVELEEDASGNLRLNGHMARGNALWKTFNSDTEVLTVFLGPHTYISPTWYSVQAVPTWNYISAHAYGTPRIVSDHDELYSLLQHLVEKHESLDHSSAGYDLTKLPEDFVEKMMGGVVGFQIIVERIEASYKLSQNRSEADYHNIIIQLRSRGDENSSEVAEAMVRVYAEKKKE